MEPVGGVQVPQTITSPVAVAPSPERRENYPSNASLGLGITQFVIGFLAFILEIVAIIIRTLLYYTGAGIWCGGIFMVSGALGIVAAKTKNVGTIGGFMAMSIISALFSCFGLLPIYSAVAVLEKALSPLLYDDRSAQYAVSMVMIVLALAEIIIGIISSSICCSATCCYTHPGTVHVYPGQHQIIYPMQPSVVCTVPQTQGQYPQHLGLQQHPQLGAGYGDPGPAMLQQTVVPPTYFEENQPPPKYDS